MNGVNELSELPSPLEGMPLLLIETVDFTKIPMLKKGFAILKLE
jgi:hypothetical protein